MNFHLSEEQELIQKSARDFAQKEVLPWAHHLDQHTHREKLLENLKQLAELGFMGLNIKSTYGGTEAGSVALSLVLTELGKVCASTAVTVSVNNMALELIQNVGTEEQKKYFIPKLCSGEFLAASFCLSETEAGSDPASMKTTAQIVDDGFIINGQKFWITSAPYAGFFIVWAITDKNAPKGKGISCFILEANTPGLRIGKEEKKMGQRGSATCEVIFDNCHIPKTALLGQLHQGFKLAVTELAGGRIGVASFALGMGLAAMEFATRYTTSRKQFNQPISDFQAIKWMIADSFTELEAAQLLILKAASYKEEGKEFHRLASMAKMYASEVAIRATHKAMQMTGGYGYTEEFPLERYARDVRVTSIYEGTNEIQRLIIANDILKSLSH